MKLVTIYAAFLLLLATHLAPAQGTIRGTVSDSSSHEWLVGVNVFVVGKALGNPTNIEGAFTIARVPAGPVRLKASCIGYESKEIEFSFEGNDTTVAFRLQPAAVLGEEIVVKGQARGQIAAINQQVNAKTIVNVVSEEKIKELPDANAAEAIGRLPGVSVIRAGGEANRILLRGMSDKFAAFTVDGVRMASTDSNGRGLDLSAISQSSLSGVELFKALTSDKDGDAIAGSVNLVTKKAPAEREVRIMAKGDYNKLDNTAKQYEFSGRYGERYLDGLLGVQIIGSLEQRNRSNDQISANWNTNLGGVGKDYEIQAFRVDYTNELRKRGGATLLLDVNTPDDGTIRLNTIYNRTSRDLVHSYRDYPKVSQATNGGLVSYDARDQRQVLNVFNTSLSGDNTLFDFGVRWGFSFAQSKSEFPYDLELLFTEASSDTSGMRSGASSITHGPPEALIPYAWNSLGSASLQWAYYRNQQNLDRERTAYVDLSRKYVLGDLLSGEVKGGGKYRQKNRFREASEMVSPYYLGYYWPYTRLYDGSIVPKNMAGTPFASIAFRSPVTLNYFVNPIPDERNVYDKYRLYPIMNRDFLHLWYEYNRNGIQNSTGGLSEYLENDQVQGDYYDITERVGAGYLMNTLDIGQEMTFIAGVRVEQENNDYASRYTPGILSGQIPPTGIIRDTSVTYHETVWLPNFQLLFKPTDFMSVRLAAYRALARPDFNQRLEKTIAQAVGTSTMYVGNPNLRSAKAANFEANVSFYGDIIGLLSLSAYYKDIREMFYLVDGAPTRGQHLLDSLGSGWGRVDSMTFPFGRRGSTFQYNLTYPLNSPRPTKVWGFEVEQQTNFTFLPGFLSGLVLNYNFSIMRTETWRIASAFRQDTVWRVIPPFPPFPEVRVTPYIYETKQKLEGQPEFLYNIALGYDVGGFSGRISVFHQGEFNRLYSSNGFDDPVVGSFTRVDLSLKQKITPNISVMFDLNNLTNAEETESTHSRVGNWTLLTQSQKYGMSGGLGVQVDL
jgi:TonB-dependent receptor